MSRAWHEDPILGKVKRTFLSGAGINGVRIAVQHFRRMDKNSDEVLTPAEFAAGLKAAGIPMTKFELDYLIKAFDKDKDGVVSLDEFLSFLVANLNARRQRVVSRVFDRLLSIEQRTDGALSAEFLLRAFDPSKHPAVRHGTMLGSTIEAEFTGGFGIDADNDGAISREEFTAFFTGVSATMPNDEVFEEMILLCFGADDPRAPRLDRTERTWDGPGDPLDIPVPEQPNDPYSRSLYRTQQKGYDTTATFRSMYRREEPKLPSLKRDWVTTSRRDFAPPTTDDLLAATAKERVVSPTGDPVVDGVRAKIIARSGKDGFLGLQRAFRIMDKSRDAQLSRPELTAGLARIGLKLSEMELTAVFAYVDRSNNGSVSVGEFARAIRGPVRSQARLDILLEAFQRLDRSNDGCIQLSELLPRYDTSRHPKVTSGELTKEQVVQEFVADWDQNSDGRIYLEEWLEYYARLSCTIDDDQYFELMIRNAWHISGGKGAARNTTCRRVLGEFTDGSKRVVEIRDDIGIRKDDIEGMKQRLIAQGHTGLLNIKLHF